LYSVTSLSNAHFLNQIWQMSIQSKLPFTQLRTIMKECADQTFREFVVSAPNATTKFAFRNCSFYSIEERKHGSCYKGLTLIDCKVQGFMGQHGIGKIGRICEDFDIHGLSIDRVICRSTVFRNCRFRKIRGWITFGLTGVVFDRCTIQDEFVRIQVLTHYDHDQKRFQKDVRWWENEYSKVVWALDITKAVFPSGFPGHVTFEGVPGEKIVRSPANSIIWSNSIAGEVNGEKLGIKSPGIRLLLTRAKFRRDNADFSERLGHLYDNHWQYQVVVNCGKTTAEFKQYDKDFDRLCKEDVAFRENHPELVSQKKVRKKK